MLLNLWITDASNGSWRPMDRVSQLDLDGVKGSSLAVQREHFGAPADTSISRRNHVTLAFGYDHTVDVTGGETGSPIYRCRPDGSQEHLAANTKLVLSGRDLADDGTVLALGRRFLRLYVTKGDVGSPMATIGPLGALAKEGADGRLLESLLAVYSAPPAERLEKARALARESLGAELVVGRARDKRARNVFVSKDAAEPVTIRRETPFAAPELALCERLAELVGGGFRRPPAIRPREKPSATVREAEELHELAQEYLGGDEDPECIQLRQDLVRLAIEYSRRLQTRRPQEALPVLALSGEPGVGKNWIVKLLVKMMSSLRGEDLPCESINLAAVTPTIAESELFGVAKEAVTGVRERKGAFERASGGVVFLDEVGRAFELQKKLFHVLDSGTFFQVGGQRPLSVEAIVIVAYNGRATDLVKSGAMDDAFASRLGVPFLVPSLGGRPGEVARLVRAHCDKRRAGTPGLDDDVVATIVDTLAAQTLWPGNHRQIRAVVDRICDLRRFDRDRILQIYESTVDRPAERGPVRTVPPWSQGWRTVGDLEEACDRALYDAYVGLRRKGQTGRAVAKTLGTKDPTLRSWIKRWEEKGWELPREE